MIRVSRGERMEDKTDSWNSSALTPNLARIGLKGENWEKSAQIGAVHLNVIHKNVYWDYGLPASERTGIAGRFFGGYSRTGISKKVG